MACTYRLERSLNGSTGWVEILTGVEIITTDYTYMSSTGLNPSTRYYYRARSYDDVAKIGSSYSNIVNGMTLSVLNPEASGQTNILAVI